MSIWKTRIELSDELPTVAVAVRGPLGRKGRGRLIIDSGSSMTILDSGFAASIDLTADRASGPSRIRGPTDRLPARSQSGLRARLEGSPSVSMMKERQPIRVQNAGDVRSGQSTTSSL